jgi:hypothetical protein
LIWVNRLAIALAGLLLIQVNSGRAFPGLNAPKDKREQKK